MKIIYDSDEEKRKFIKYRMWLGLGMMLCFLVLALIIWLATIIAFVVGWWDAYSFFSVFFIGPVLYIVLSYMVMTRVFKYDDLKDVKKRNKHEKQK